MFHVSHRQSFVLANQSPINDLRFCQQQPFKSIVENDSNENIFDMNHSKNASNKKKSTSTFRAFKKKQIQKLNLIDIVEINISTYYYLIRNKKNKLFSLIINEIYDTLIQFFEILL